MSGLAFLIICVVIGVGYGMLLLLFPERFAALGEKLPGQRLGPSDVKKMGVSFIAFGGLAFVAIFAFPLLTGNAW